MKKNKEIINSIKATLHSAGEKESNIDSPSVSSKNEIYYPSLYLNVEQLPELDGKDVDDTITLVVKGKITSHSKREYSSGDDRETYDIEIKKIGLVK